MMIQVSRTAHDEVSEGVCFGAIKTDEEVSVVDCTYRDRLAKDDCFLSQTPQMRRIAQIPPTLNLSDL